MDDRIFSSSVAANATAGRVVARGTHWQPDLKPSNTQHWKAPPPCRTPPGGPSDLTGTRFGRFAVVGYLGSPNPKKKARWLCRCSCGDFEARSARAIANPANARDMCRECRHLEHVKQRKPLSCEEYLGLAPAGER